MSGTQTLQVEGDAHYTSRHDKLPVIHRKVDALGGRTAVTKASKSKDDDVVKVSSDIPLFRPVVTPKPKKAPAKKKPAPKKKAPAKKKRAGPKPKYDYPGDVHYVVDLEGIGPTYEKKLHGANIYNTQELLFTGDKRLENITGASPKTIQNWKDMSQLVKVKGIGPQFAELMVRAGISGGIDDLKALKPKAAVQQIQGYTRGLKSHVTGSGIGMKRMTSFQQQAKAMRKVPIDLKKIEVVDLGARQAISNTGDKKLKPSRAKTAQKATGTFPEKLKTSPKKPAATKKAAPPAAKKSAQKNARCAAKTAAGKRCSNSSRDRSKYCASHKGYRP